ncbi:MAG: hypothetical protein ACYTGC_06630, partial [Planctomycetota bacterium]
MSLLEKLYQGWRWRVVPAMLRVYLRPRGRSDLRRLGSGTGAWVVPTSLVDRESVCYCAGVGEDISSDRALIDLAG